MDENATVTVAYKDNAVTITLDGPELATGYPETYRYLGSASRDFIGDEVEKALIALVKQDVKPDAQPLGETPLPAHTATSYQIWIADPDGTPLYVFRSNLPLEDARELVADYRAGRNLPVDMPPRAFSLAFAIVKTVTAYAVVAD